MHATACRHQRCVAAAASFNRSGCTLQPQRIRAVAAAIVPIRYLYTTACRTECKSRSSTLSLTLHVLTAV
eukprot:9725-Heterococcus_DN1.PRE.2